MKKKQLILTLIYLQITNAKYVPKHLLHFSSSFLNNFYKTDSQNLPSKMENQ